MGDVVLYHSERTQVLRRGSRDGSTLIHKRATGLGAARRIERERAVLLRLAGVPGVPRLADHQSRQLLVLEDDAAFPVPRPMPVPELLTIGRSLAATLAAVHRAGVVHRDVTPANVVLPPHGPALLIDFDLALAGAVEADEAGGPVGTLGFLAPEQTGRIGPAVDPRADLYGLGATLYTLAVGEPPFTGDDALELIRETLVEPPPVPAGLPPRLRDIIMRLLEKDPANRYQSAEGLLHDLTRCRDDPDAGWPLGERDFPARFVPPAALIGRDREVHLLTSALDRALTEGGRPVLITGPSGIGKSALTRSLRPAVTARGGWFAAGRFEEFRTGTTSGGITRALRSLIRCILAEPEPEVAADRARIVEALGPNAVVAVNAIPEMADLLGVPGGPSTSDPSTAQGRTAAAALALIRALAAGHRIVIVLEDLQWATAGTHRVLDAIVNAGPIPGLLLVATYRDEGRPLAALLDRWQRDGATEPVIRVGGLDREGAARLIGTVLRIPPEAASVPAGLIEAGAAGNPFATVEVLNALRAEGLLRPVTDGWRWEADAIRDFVRCHGVPQLLAARMDQQAGGTRRILAALACLGGDVGTGFLAIATGTSEADLAARLAPAVTDGLILLADGTVRFRHDLVRQAARDCLAPGDRDRLQLSMARELSRRERYRQEAAEQYLPVVDLVDAPDERRAAAGLLHGAAQRTMKMTNYQVSVELLAAAERLLGPGAEERDAVTVARHTALYCLGRLDEADEVYRELAARSPDLLALAAATANQVNSLTQRGHIRKAYALGADLLRRFGIDSPDDPGPVVHREAADLRDCAADLSRAAETDDPRVLAAGRILNRLLAPAYVLGPLQHTWVLLQVLGLWRRAGLCPPVVGSLGAVICATIHLFDDYRTGHRLSRYVVEAGREHGYQAETAIARYMHLFVAAHWFEPLEDIAEAGQDAREELLTAGDVQVAAMLSARLVAVLLETADSLETVAEEIDASVAFAERTGNRIAALSLTECRALVRVLRGREPGAEPDGSPTFPVALAIHHVNRALAALMCQDDEELDRHAAGAMEHCEAVRGLYTWALARVVRGIALAARVRYGDTGVAAELGTIRDWIARRAADSPRNFRPLLRLVDAERCWALGDPDGAAREFDAGLHEVAGRPWHRAVLAQRAARFHLDRGFAHAGRQLLTEARDTYRQWGAEGPLRRLEAEHPFLRAERVSDSGHGAGADRIDLMAILRASRALSSAITLADLEAQVGDVLSAMTGATRVQLVLRHPETRDPRPVPATAVRYVTRTRRPLLVADATQDDRFARDPYVAGLDHCSLLAMPIPSRTVDVAVLMLENHRQGGVFSTDRLETVELIAGQLAVSLDNALLYDSLEDTVRVRTSDLEAANQLKADLIGMLGHEINNPLAAILGGLDLVLDEEELPESVHHSLIRVHRTTRRLAAIVQEVLDLVSLDAGRLVAAPVPVRVAEHVEAALVVAGAGHVPVTCPPDLVAVVQPSHLDQILTNLVSNAAKYGGGATAVVARADTAVVTIEVRDEGPGVPPAFRDRLFDRFARAEPTAGKVPGTGLGLYIVRELARANHGDVHYRPGPDGGSSFEVTLMQPEGGGSRQGGVRAKEGLV
ncbi:serine/threonine protein kinase [Actinoplanes lobatus]|uniref:histidine kinase n=1 Tax=Actinoplanes lobatus TaxID=113568 RepID=A0A7W7HFD7_9ACTN|nr:AAA family ATPase [Actinoplanes lobatus]MBB4749548.1 signal transduction histidine kinase [Actinoplanes lobatus]GGN77935.1 serine/threonine protein kinase [Actinoplanes lobatus]GIE38286.1 serine/threonine protein kinase [Actinoplanes lobatus]